MKKLVLLILVIAVFQAQAQHQLYIGLETGPKWTFTENLTGLYHKTTDSQLGYSCGFVAGTIFPQGNFTVETGFSRLSYDFKYNMEHGPYPSYQRQSRPKGYIEPKLVVSSESFQIPLRIKSRLYNTQHSKFSLWLTGGAAFTKRNFNNYEINTNFIVIDDPISNQIYLSRQIDEQTFSEPVELIFMTGYYSSILIELGLENHFKVTDKLALSLAGRYQGGFKSMIASKVKDTVRDSRSGTFKERVYTLSNGDGIFLNIGLLYTFGKRSQKSDNLPNI